MLYNTIILQIHMRFYEEVLICLTVGCFSGPWDAIVEEIFYELNCHAKIENKNKI